MEIFREIPSYNLEVNRPTSNTGYVEAAQIVQKNTIPSKWNEMLDQIGNLFEHNAVDIDTMKIILARYQSNESDWGPYAYFDPYRYTRNLIDKGNGKYNLMLLCWPPNTVSGIHDHSNSHCFVKVLQGHLSEEMYHIVDDCGENKMFKINNNTYDINQVTYINDSIGVHRMSNQDTVMPTVSLHLYCPPFDSCRTFDENNGKVNKCTVTFHSQFGQRAMPNIGNMDKFTQVPPKVATPSFIATK